MNPTATGHQATKTCKAMHAARLQRKAVSDSAVAMDAKFYAYGEELETAFCCSLAACMALHVFVAW